jgi:tRNA (guanosine-2'-O-)-methyltransferase
MKKLQSTELKRLHREWRRRTPGRLALVLDHVQSPFNVGAIVRTAAAYRVDHVWTANGTPPLDETKVGKTALGSERFVTWEPASTSLDAVHAARAAGYACVALELADGAVPLHEVALGADVCVVVGNEDHGIPGDTLEACDTVAFLPQLGRIGSLNVATATSIALYEVRRRAWT